MSTDARPALALTALAVATGALIAWMISALELDHRLDAFLPAPQDPHQALVVDQVGGGAGSRTLFAAIEGDNADTLAEASRALAETWRALPGVERVENGEISLDPDTERALMKARFVLLPDVGRRLEPENLNASMADRLAELALAGRRVETLVRRDPLGLLPAIGERLAPAAAPDTHDEVWFGEDEEGRPRALLLVVGADAGFDVASQADLIRQLRSGFDALENSDAFELALAGSPVIAADSAERARTDAVRLSLAGGLFLLIVLGWSWRSAWLVVAGALPLGVGVICGLAVVLLAFEGVHGLTLAFGFTLLGVALDYPIHLFGHAAGRRLDLAARSIRAPLLLGAVSTLIAYIMIWVSSSPGLAQLGAFSAAGLAGAALATLLLPVLGLNAPQRAVRRATGRNLHLPWLPLVLGGLALAVLVALGDRLWSSDLSRLSPVDQDLLADDVELRRALGAGDVRYLLVASDDNLEPVLVDTETTVALLVQARADGLLEGWHAVTDLVPSQASQESRRAAWPPPDALAQQLAEAAPRFQSDAFDPFVADLAEFQQNGSIGPDSWDDTALASRVDSLLDRGEHGWRSIILPAGLTDPAALHQWLAERDAPVELVDLRASSEAMVQAYRRDAGTSLAIALALIAVVLLVRLRGIRPVGQVLVPPLAAIACTAAVLGYLHGGLTIVHLVGLLLAAGVGLDFAIFSQTLRHGAEQLARTNRSVNLCALSSGGVFLILGQSSIGMLRMLGMTVAVGILLSWLFARVSQPPLHR